MIRLSSSVRLIRSAGRGVSTGGSGARPVGFLPVGGRGLGLAGRQLGLILGLLAQEALTRPRLDLGPGLGERSPPVLAARQFVGDRHPVGTVGLIRHFCLRHQLGHLGLQLRLDLARVLVGQRAVPAGVGVYLRPVERHRPQLEQAHLTRQQQYLHEQPLDPRQSSGHCPGRRRNAATVSWSGCRFAAMKRKATLS
jgi:hypothetical protein